MLIPLLKILTACFQLEIDSFVCRAVSWPSIKKKPITAMNITNDRPIFDITSKKEILNKLFLDDRQWQAFFYACSSPTVQYELNRPSLRFAKGHIMETYIASIVGGKVVDETGYDVVMDIGGRECRIECKFEAKPEKRRLSRRLANKMGEGDGGHAFSCDVLLFISCGEVNAIFSDEITSGMLKRTKDAVLINVDRESVHAGPIVSAATSCMAPSSRTFVGMFEGLCRDFVDLTREDYLALTSFGQA